MMERREIVFWPAPSLVLKSGARSGSHQAEWILFSLSETFLCFLSQEKELNTGFLKIAVAVESI